VVQHLGGAERHRTRKQSARCRRGVGFNTDENTKRCKKKALTPLTKQNPGEILLGSSLDDVPSLHCCHPPPIPWNVKGGLNQRLTGERGSGGRLQSARGAE